MVLNVEGKGWSGAMQREKASERKVVPLTKSVMAPNETLLFRSLELLTPRGATPASYGAIQLRLSDRWVGTDAGSMG
jgi:hypothetical protein